MRQKIIPKQSSGEEVFHMATAQDYEDCEDQNANLVRFRIFVALPMLGVRSFFCSHREHFFLMAPWVFLTHSAVPGHCDGASRGCAILEARKRRKGFFPSQNH